MPLANVSTQRLIASWSAAIRLPPHWRPRLRQDRVLVAIQAVKGLGGGGMKMRNPMVSRVCASKALIHEFDPRNVLRRLSRRLELSVTVFERSSQPSALRFPSFQSARKAYAADTQTEHLLLDSQRT